MDSCDDSTQMQTSKSTLTRQETHSELLDKILSSASVEKKLSKRLPMIDPIQCYY